MAQQCVQGNLEERASQFLVYIDRFRLQYQTARGAIRAGALLAVGQRETDLGANCYNTKTVVLSNGVPSNASGPWQIMAPTYLSTYHVNAQTVWELEASTDGVVQVLQNAHDDLLDGVPEAESNLQIYAYLLYAAHHGGRGYMNSMITRARSKAAGQPITLATLQAVTSGDYVSAYLDVAQGSDSYRGAEAWEQWATSVRGPSAPLELAARAAQANPWGAPLLATVTGLALIAFASAVYLEKRGARSRYLHWAPAR